MMKNLASRELNRRHLGGNSLHLSTLLTNYNNIVVRSKLVELEECSHPTVMKDMCAECGADLRCDLTIAPNSTASVPMVHSVPDLKVRIG